MGSLHGSGIALTIGLVGAFWGGLGIANAAQDAMNRVWEVPMRARPNLPKRVARSLGLIATFGVAIIATVVLSGIGGGSGSLGFPIRAAAVVLGLVFNVVLFAFAFRVLTSHPLSWNEVLPGAIVSHQLKGMSQTYGLFALVLGLLAWIYLQARLVIYAAEVNVVRAKRLWPRALAPPPLTEGDKRAYEEYAKTEERRPEEHVDVDVDGEAVNSSY